MRIIENEKKKIQNILKKIISANKFIYDIWVYGNFTDKISDLDLIVIYKDNPIEIIFPNLIKKLVADGTVIYIGYKNRNDVFLFENIKTFSIKKNKLLIYKINNNFKKFRYLTSFIERYYERRTLLKEKKIRNLTNINIRNIKSIFFSYENFLSYSKNLKVKKNYQKINKIYNTVRNAHNEKKLKIEKYRDFIKKIKAFDKNFNNISLSTLEKKFLYKKVPNFVFKFRKKIFYSKNDITSKKVFKVPNIFFYIFFFYGKQKFEISKLIFKDFRIQKKININFTKVFSSKFIKFLKKRIKFLNTNFLVLKKNKFKTGLYKFAWYLN